MVEAVFCGPAHDVSATEQFMILTPLQIYTDQSD